MYSIHQAQTSISCESQDLTGLMNSKANKSLLLSFFDLSFIIFLFFPRQIHIESKFLQTGPSSSPSKYKLCLKI